ncbi:intracellular proteinase [Enterococcus sp. PF-2]|uniref:Intracellular proteinase n=1 Tax=Enterococcus casseliflavus ATCC 12755 TaxID=888066 RepID=F0EKN8_ENTCA|nr:intracellular proteinase [Enterococcus sp. CR-Ec1]AVC42309.1 intracellular proteinase [Enterococcus gallinarum]EGC69329.1 hypothetical protein HMPREF9087_1944 [Enterococcus casseliflavus ATCC 12755]EPH93531.1 hypothetical protein D922_02073 [Enterococcus faecalis 06-MB-DW-09]MBO1121126.1 intracellular proteinase [Enterococcus casseliflavus]TPE06628.1 intracellular proteinase [Enterococcus sp. PF-3]TPE28095.1 intracellular proteinase [Enterococcus sp. PF-2]
MKNRKVIWLIPPLKETFSFVEVMKRMNRARWSVPLNVCHAPDLPQFSDSL